MHWKMLFGVVLIGVNSYITENGEERPEKVFILFFLFFAPFFHLVILLYD